MYQIVFNLVTLPWFAAFGLQRPVSIDSSSLRYLLSSPQCRHALPMPYLNIVQSKAHASTLAKTHAHTHMAFCQSQSHTTSADHQHLSPCAVQRVVIRLQRAAATEPLALQLKVGGSSVHAKTGSSVHAKRILFIQFIYISS